MSKLKQDKIPVNIEEGFKYKLVRESDGLTRYGKKIGWIKWKDGKFKELQDKPDIRLSCILDPHIISFTWCTTPIVSILEKREDYLKFSTRNSIYELWHV